MRLSQKIVHPRLFKWFANVGRWDMHSFVMLRWQGATLKMHSCWHVFFQDKFHQYDCSEKLCTQDLPKFPNPGHGTCIASLAGSKTKRAELLARIFQDKFRRLSKNWCQRLLKWIQMVSKRWAKGHAWEKVLCWRGFHFRRRSVRRC